MFRLEARAYPGGMWEAYRSPESGTFDLFVTYRDAWDEAVVAYKEGLEVRIVNGKGNTVNQLTPTATQNRAEAHNPNG